MTNLFEVPSLHACPVKSENASESDIKTHYLIHAEALPYDATLHHLHTLRVRNHSGRDVIIRERNNIQRCIASTPHQQHNTLDILVTLDFSSYEFESLKQLADSEGVDANLRKILRDIDVIYKRSGNSSISFTQCFQIPRCRIDENDGGLFIEQLDLQISRADSNKMQFHQLSDYMLRHGQREQMLAYWNNEFCNVVSTKIVTHDKNRCFVYQATAEGVQVLKVTHNPHELVEHVEIVRSRVYPDGVPSLDRADEVEVLQYSFSEMEEKLGIFLSSYDATIASIRMRKPQQVVEVLKAQTDVQKSENDVRKEQLRSESLRNERELENTSSFNKGVTETIKTLGAVAGGIVALIGLVKLVRG